MKLYKKINIFLTVVLSVIYNFEYFLPDNIIQEAEKTEIRNILDEYRLIEDAEGLLIC